MRTELRAAGRVDVRRGEGISALLLREGRESIPLVVMDYSSTGFGVETARSRSIEDVGVDSTLEVSFQFMRRQFDFQCRVIRKERGAKGRVRLGLRRVNSERPELKDLGGGKSARLLNLPGDVEIAGLAVHPFLYDHRSLIKVTAISRKLFVARCFDRSFVVFPEMTINFDLSTFFATEPVTGRVMRVWDDQQGGVEFSIRIDDLPRSTEKGIVQYVLQFLDWEPLKLKQVGFLTEDVKSVVNFRYSRTPEDYEAVRRLRLAAYSAVGKIDRGADISAVTYDYDQFSRILTAWHHDRLVASVTVLFADGDKNKFEIQKLIPAEDFQKLGLPATMVEVAGLCIHHDYRKSDILLGLFERLFHVLVTSGRLKIIAGTDKHLWKIYRDIGFRKTGIKYRIPKYGDLEHDVIEVHRRVGSYGLGLDPVRWDRVWHSVADHLNEEGVLKRKWNHRLVGAGYRASVRLAKFFANLQSLFSRSPD